MSELEATVADVALLLSALPGAIVSNATIAQSDVRFEIELDDAESASALQHISLGANILVRSRFESYELDWRDTSAWLRKPLELVATFSPRGPEIALGQLQLLGIHLVWYLHRRRLIVQGDANEYLRKWNAVTVAG